MPNRKSRSIRATDEEWDTIERRAKKAGMRRSEYMRKAALGVLADLDSAVLHHQLHTLVSELYKIRKPDAQVEGDQLPSLSQVLRNAERLLDDVRESRRLVERKKPF